MSSKKKKKTTKAYVLGKPKELNNCVLYFHTNQDWNQEFNIMLSAMGCPYYYGIDICNTPEEEDNYETFLRLPSTR